MAGGTGGGETINGDPGYRFTRTPPQGFIRKYIFSLDHKVIGIQYFFLALTAVFVGMLLSLLMRIHMVWPTAVLPLVGEIKPEAYLAC